MGNYCLESTIKSKTNIPVIQPNFKEEEAKKEEDKEEKDFQDFSKSSKKKIITECSNISSSRLSVSDDVQDDDGNENENKN